MSSPPPWLLIFPQIGWCGLGASSHLWELETAGPQDWCVHVEETPGISPPSRSPELLSFFFLRTV